MKIYTQNEDKYQTKYHSKMIQNAYFTHLVGLIGLHEAWTFYANRSSGNTHPLKSWQELTVDVTSPNKSNIYLCASWTMRQLSAQLQTATPGQHKTNTCIPKMWFLPVWHNYTKFPHHKKCRYGSMMQTRREESLQWSHTNECS